ncbi:MAG: NADH-dependent [FeFe] hydrogenase, group A6 [Candidatus Omnitrophica bacterium]|jgi:iron-only hydrogenase group A|nr:NADH-dependent [FeFe] hydrogenase, group A6 [Candidatus Omnitrophota bacterium]
MSEEKISLRINDSVYECDAGMTILEACAKAAIDIPTLCYLKDINQEAACSICLVEVKGAKALVRSCVTPVRKDMEIFTNTPRVRKARRMNLELLLAGHPKDCLVCDRNQSCELRKLAFDMGVRDVRFPKTTKTELPLDTTSVSLTRDPNKCILCGRCVSVCSAIQSVKAIDFSGRGKSSKITTFFDSGLANSVCVNCGQCLLVCPTGAITEKNATGGVWAALSDPKKFVIVEVAPAVRAAIGEEFGLPAGSLVTAKLAQSLRKLGFDKVFDTQFSADLTIMEEGYELIDRIKNKGSLPLITSCSPGWIKFAEHFYSGILEHISSCKSPQQMFGAIAKTYYARKFNLDPRNMVVVSIMPCTAKKFEALRPEMKSAFDYWKDELNLKESEAFYDVDFVLTTREASRLIKEAGINFINLPGEDFDEPLGISTGAAVIFGATGGVMEAALRTAYEVLCGRQLEKIDFFGLRGLEGIKVAEVDIDGLKLKVAVASSLSKARLLLDEVKEGKSPYAFIEIMTCPGGCLGGAGQPIPTDNEIRLKRMEAIYREDKSKSIRKSHENPAVRELYKEFLGQPLGEKSHHLLHTHYKQKEGEF